MNRYLAKIIFRIITTENDKPIGLFEEKLCLIHANNYRDALNHAIKWGQNETSEFTNDNGQLIQWEFVSVPELKCIPDSTNTIELCSHLVEMPGTEYANLQKDKQMQLSFVDE